jgi:hypothetical protein
MVVVLVVGLVLPKLSKTMHKAPRMNCVSNLKQIGTAFRLWAYDFGGKEALYPGQVSTNSHGAMELLARGEVWAVFQVMSYDLGTPRILVCPSDAREAATSFASLGNTNLSYFVSRDARQDLPDSVLAGDRNLEVAGRPVAVRQLPLTTNLLIGWTTNQHIRAGNVLLADGAMRQLSSAGFQRFLSHQPLATNRIVIP